MKHENIAAVLNWTSVEDLTEGIFLQPEEALAIDKALDNAAAGATAVTELAKANETISSQATQISNMEAAATDNATQIISLTDRVSELEAQLGGKPSGNGSVLTTTSEEVEEPIQKTGKLPRYDSPDHPGNQAANSRKRK